MTRLLAAVMILAPALASGCISPPPPLEHDTEVRSAVARLDDARASSGAPKLVIALPPVTTPYSKEAPRNDPTRMPVKVNERDLGATIARDLGMAFHRVVAVPRRVVEGGDVKARERAFQDAADARADVIAQVTLRSFDNDFRGRCWWTWPWNLAVYGYAWIPSWFVPDLEFGARAHATLELWGVASERPLLEKPVEVKADVSRVLNNIQRGWSVFGILTMPYSLDGENWREVGDRLNPHALHDIRKGIILGAAEAALGDLSPGELTARDATTFAVLIGVARYRAEAIPAPGGASRDVAEMKRLLVEHLGVPRKNILTLENGDATGDGIARAIEGLAKRARPGDAVLLYFSGSGALVTPEGVAGDGAAAARTPAILPIDADPRRLAATALPLHRLGDLAGKLGVARTVIAIDAGFEGGPRSLETPGAPAADSAYIAAARAAPATLLVATGPGGVAGDMPGPNQGYFTFAPSRARAARRTRTGIGA
jgi:hypothetical protein